MEFNKSHDKNGKNALFSSKSIHELPKRFEEKPGQPIPAYRENIYKRSSTPFQVKKIPSPYYGFLERPIERKVDYSLLKNKLKKTENEFILIEESMRKQIKLSESLKNKIPISNKRKGLKRTLTGIIEEDQKNQLERNKNMSSLFSKNTKWKINVIFLMFSSIKPFNPL